MEITQIPIPQVVISDKDLHFTGALATNAAEEENLTGLKFPTGVIESVTLTSDQNLDWDLYFFATDALSDTNLDTEHYLGKVRFVATDGEQIAGAGQYYYDTATCSYAFRPFAYVDKDAIDWYDTQSGAQSAPEIHVALVNRNATSKNAGATGEVGVRVVFRADGLIQNKDVI